MRPILVLFTLSLSFPQCTGLHPSSGLLLRLTSKGSSSSLCSGPLCSLPLPDIMSEHVTVIHSHGGAELEAAITPGSRQGWAAVVCHPWGKLGGDMDNPVVITLKNALARRGFTVCRFNFRGVGGSTGGGSFTAVSECKDVEAVCRFLVEGAPVAGRPTCPPAERIALVGYSYGSMVVCSCIDSVPQAVGACAVSYPFDYTWALAVWNAGTLWRAFESSGRKRLMVCGDRDGFCSVNNFERRSRAVREEGGESRVFQGVDHFWRGGTERNAMALLVAEWAEQSCM